MLLFHFAVHAASKIVSRCLLVEELRWLVLLLEGIVARTATVAAAPQKAVCLTLRGTSWHGADSMVMMLIKSVCRVGGVLALLHVAGTSRRVCVYACAR